MLFLDEVGFDFSNRDRWAWIPRGEDVPLKKEPKQKNLSVIGALDTQGMYAYMVVKGAVTWEIFVFFIHRVAELLQSYHELENTYFVFDNARSHTCKNAGNFLDGRVHYRFQPPYSPQINPIEFAWAKI